MERRTLSITGYGIYVVSIASLKRFLSIKNVKSKNILQVFQNNPDLYFESLSEGIWIPILPIDCISTAKRIAPFLKNEMRIFKEKRNAATM